MILYVIICISFNFLFLVVVNIEEPNSTLGRMVDLIWKGSGWAHFLGERGSGLMVGSGWADCEESG